MGSSRICAVTDVASQVLHLNHFTYTTVAFSLKCPKSVSTTSTRVAWAQYELAEWINV